MEWQIHDGISPPNVPLLERNWVSNSSTFILICESKVWQPERNFTWTWGEIVLCWLMITYTPNNNPILPPTIVANLMVRQCSKESLINGHRYLLEIGTSRK